MDLAKPVRAPKAPCDPVLKLKLDQSALPLAASEHLVAEFQLSAPAGWADFPAPGAMLVGIQRPASAGKIASHVDVLLGLLEGELGVGITVIASIGRRQ